MFNFEIYFIFMLVFICVYFEVFSTLFCADNEKSVQKAKFNN